jgi:formylglycine-generating enzyme required for sulfatase activity
MIRILAVIISTAAFISSYAFAADIKNQVVTQKGSNVVFEFDIEGEEAETEVSIILTIENRKYGAYELHIEGDFGKVKVGMGKKIVWDVLRDFPKGLETTIEGEITADGKTDVSWSVDPEAATLTDGAPVKGMAFVKGGCFQMGDVFNEGDMDERPVHEVCIGDFYIEVYEVTQAAYKKVMRANPSGFKGKDLPVEKVTWQNASDYCEKVGKRLPTEAEWEYAARSGGKEQRWAGTNNESSLDGYAWFRQNADGKTHAVGKKQPNALGVYDMSGNVWEWVSDWYQERYYSKSPRNNPAGPVVEGSRVLRGGSWINGAKNVRVANRLRHNPNYSHYDSGFRCAKTCQAPF